jgi:hypothetical protein
MRCLSGVREVFDDKPQDFIHVETRVHLKWEIHVKSAAGAKLITAVEGNLGVSPLTARSAR